MAHDKEAVISGKHEGNVILAPERAELPPNRMLSPSFYMETSTSKDKIY